MMEDSLSVTGERGGGPGVGGLRPMRGGGTGMAMDKLGGAEEDRTRSGIGSPSPLSSAIGFFCLIYALLNFSFSNIHMEHLLYFLLFLTFSSSHQ